MSRIRIGSFNVRNLADGEGRDLDRIAKMINYYHLDIVALQEVLAEGKVIGGIDLKEPSGQAKAYDRSLKRRLSGPWDSQWAQPVLSRENEPFRGEDRRGEGYAILWRTDKFDLPLGRWGEPYRPEILSNYNPVIAESQLRLIRDPLYARFLLKDRHVAELRILVSHIVYGKSGALNDVIDYSAAKMRQKEFDILAGQLYRRVAEYYKVQDCTSPYTVLLGDYNLNLGAYPAVPAVACFDAKGRPVDESRAKAYIYTYQTDASTIKRDTPEYANNYDHFSFDERTRRIVRMDSIHSIDLVNKYTKSEDVTQEQRFDRYRKEISDHLPIMMEVDL